MLKEWLSFQNHKGIQARVCLLLKPGKRTHSFIILFLSFELLSKFISSSVNEINFPFRNPSAPFTFEVKYHMIPHPQKKEKGGEDAFFISSDKRAFGLADGFYSIPILVSHFRCWRLDNAWNRPCNICSNSYERV